MEETDIDSISISWDPVDINGIVDGYLVYYQPRSTSDPPFNVPATSNPSVSLYFIDEYFVYYQPGSTSDPPFNIPATSNLLAKQVNLSFCEPIRNGV